jgi:outer membrane immunogenic protein
MGAVVEETPCMKEGFYVGAGIGGAMYNDKVEARNPITLVSREKSFNTNSALASAFIGLGHTWFDTYFLGLEANTYFPHHKVEWPNRQGVTATTYTFRNRFLVQNYINLDLLPGYRVNPNWLVYGRAGLAFSDLIANEDGVRAGNVPPFSDTTTTIGGRFGAGINYQLSQHIGAGVDYFYSYNPLTSTSFNDLNAVIGLSSHYNYVGFSLFYTV